MHYGILGTTQAFRDDGTPASLGGARLRALLTVLALYPGRAVPAGALVDEVWDGDPPADAPGALQALVGRLRRALGRDAVESVENGYRLVTDPDRVDLSRFERLAGEGARALEDGDGAKALALLDEALALWRGPALADLPDREAPAARWEARRLDARRTRAGAVLALGRAEDALPDLVALCADHPLDEPLQALRVKALARAGRTAQALAAYDEVRTVLADRLGTDPGPELRALYGELLHQGQDPLPPAPAPAEAPAPAVRTPPRGNLRARLTSFVGREADIAALRDDLSRARLVTLLGPGGAGKTRLSQEAAEAVAASWPDGVWLAELAPVDDPAVVAEAVLSALDARETVLRGAGAEELRAVERGTKGSAGQALAQLTEHCAKRRMLLLLDNCEHLIEAAARLADHLLAHCPGLTILATSREPLGVPGELLRPLDPLPDPVALRLLADRGAAARPGFRTDADPETAAACAEICHRLDGLPLAIELAAARLRMLGPRQIADRLDDRFRLLTSGSRTVLPRQKTLRAVVDWSWDLLDPAERAVLRRLSVFSGGCALAAAEEVCAGDGIGPFDVAGLLGSLVDKSLVVAASGDDGDMRYRLLETVAEYAAERLDEAGERAATEWRHLVHFRELARTTDPALRGAEQLAALARFRREYENLRTALRHAVATGDEHEALCLVLSLAWYWQMRDLRAEARQWADAVAELGPDPFAEPVEPAPSLLARCTDSPPPMVPEQLQEARRGVRLIQLVSMDHEANEWMTSAGRKRLRAVARTYRPGQPQTCRAPGSLWLFAVMFTGDLHGFRELLDETVRACRELGYVWELAAALQMRANALANRPDWAGEARRDADESLGIYEGLGDAWGAAEALSSRGEANERAGDSAAAAEDFRAAVAYAERLGAQAQVAMLRARYASALCETGRGEEGERILREVIADDRGSGPEARPAARLYLTLWLGRTGRTAEAREYLESMLGVPPADAVDLFEGFVLGVQSWLDNLDGLHGTALGRAVRALSLSREGMAQMVAPQMTAIHLVTVAWALAGLGGERRAADAARLLALHDALLPAGYVPTASERTNLLLTEELVRAGLPDGEARDRAYAEGGGLTLEEATALMDAHVRETEAG
ncbi:MULTISPECIES: BTAD domain-containing putative transcriptional regulator [unclassified Streptomyces]|uniref:AfsR/SARP family transcriptional regulator n=1 Tax=unclassified Streptomyces TaxID=2593676 RepID=UPI000CD4EACC|nr:MULTISPECIES: BTAD domain-containing putative transcriptional regulator [unclassified Streptomyces]AWL38082.1 AfsR/SARP family transcriptional regulator [Streptomyces sp. SM18]